MVRKRKNNKVVCVGFAFVTCVTLLCIWVKYYTPLWYYQNSMSLHELPLNLIDPAFKKFTKFKLPEKKEQLRAIFRGGRESAMFVQFHTDNEGILYIQDAFMKLNGIKFEKLESSLEQYPILDLFYFVTQWKKQLGIDLFNKIPEKSVLICEYNSQYELRYKVVIDTYNKDIYIYVYYT